MKPILGIFTLFLFTLSLFGAPTTDSIGGNSAGNNYALLVSVSHGLPGLEYDIKNMKEISEHSSNQFKVATLADVNVTDISKALTETAEAPDSRGSLLFYFTGHGNKGVILAEDRTMKIAEIRAAVEKGREKWGPLPRLVMFFDSCHSGSLLDPLRSFLKDITTEPAIASAEMADAITQEFSQTRDGAQYWKELFVFASAGAEETCLAGEEGSAFTVGLKKAWDEVGKADGNINTFIEKTKSYTNGSHPVARLVPTTMGEQKLAQ